MKVNGTGASGIDRTNDVGASRAVGDGKEKRRSNRAPDIESGVADRVAISNRGKEAAKAKSIAKAAPDIDTEKVQRLKAAIADGSYQVDVDKIADKMFDDHLRNPI